MKLNIDVTADQADALLEAVQHRLMIAIERTNSANYEIAACAREDVRLLREVVTILDDTLDRANATTGYGTR